MISRLIGPTAFAVGLLFGGSALADTSLEPRVAQIMPNAAESILNDILKVGDVYLAVGDRGHVLRSTDGDKWVQIQTPVQAMLTKLRFLDDQRGWAVGHDGTILQTEDAGKSWRLTYSDTSLGKPLYDILFLNENDGYVVGANGMLMRTSDGGENWEVQEPDFTIHGLHLNTILKLDDGTLVVGGEKGMMIRSLDDGETWQHVKTPYAGSFFGMLPYGKSGVFVYGLRGNVYAAKEVKTLEEQETMDWDEFSLETVTDNAELNAINWHYYENDLKESLFGGAILGSEDVLLVGVNGAVVRTRNGRMEALDTGLEHTLGSALVTNGGLITVGLSGIRSIAFGQ
ncbi:MAG: WD40/YVTN/BNR-like repeat-containing protein [Oceanococcus sp.]